MISQIYNTSSKTSSADQWTYLLPAAFAPNSMILLRTIGFYYMAPRREAIDIMTIDAIKEYCDKITNYIHELAINRQNFLANERVQDLCAFYCLQIGEFANTLSDAFIENHPDVEWRKIINLRNIIAHDYGTIDPEILWEIIIKNVPELQQFCHTILN